MATQLAVFIKDIRRMRISALQTFSTFMRKGTVVDAPALHDPREACKEQKADTWFLPTTSATQWDLSKRLENETVFDSKTSEKQLRLWAVFTDAVLGGKSFSELGYTTAGTYLFRGTLQVFSRRQNPNQLRYDPNDAKNESVGTVMVLPSFARTRFIYVYFLKDLSDFDGLRIRVRGDGRPYQLQLKHNDFDTFSFHHADFQTKKGEWMTIELPWEEFKINNRGRTVGYQKPQLTQITGIGFGVEDFVVGDFWLEFESIEAYVKPKRKGAEPSSSTSETTAAELNNESPQAQEKKE